MKLLPLLVVLAATSCASEPPEQTELSFSISGMHCNSCVESITAEIERIKDVTSCSVSLEHGSALVTTTNPNNTASVLEGVRKLQFTIEFVGETQAGHSQE